MIDRVRDYKGKTYHWIELPASPIAYGKWDPLDKTGVVIFELRNGMFGHATDFYETFEAAVDGFEARNRRHHERLNKEIMKFVRDLQAQGLLENYIDPFATGTPKPKKRPPRRKRRRSGEDQNNGNGKI